MKFFLLSFSLIFIVNACASGKCRKKKDNKDFVQQVSGLPEFKKKKNKEITYSDLETVQIFIADGSKQCESESQMPVTFFKEKLDKAGVKVIKVNRKSDGVMRPQVCGAPTGMIYVFDILKLDLRKAQGLGFQVHKASMY